MLSHENLLGCLGQEVRRETEEPSHMHQTKEPKIFYDFYTQKLTHTSLLGLQISITADAREHCLMK